VELKYLGPKGAFEEGYDIFKVKEANFTASELFKGGYPLEDIISVANYSPPPFTVEDLRGIGATVIMMKAYNYTVNDLFDGGFTIIELLGATLFLDMNGAEREMLIFKSENGFEDQELIDAGIATRADITEAKAVDTSCPGGNYFDLDTDGCTECLPGTFSGEIGIRVGFAVLSGCKGQCSSGFTSDFGAKSIVDCFFGAVLMEAGSTTSAWCEGSSTTSRFVFPNRGYAYIRSESDCTELATGLLRSNTSKLPMGDTEVFLRCQEQPNDASCLDVVNSAVVNRQAPIGYCGVLQPGTNGTDYDVVFYTGAGASLHPLEKHGTFQAICKIKSCAYMEEIEGNGARRPWDAKKKRTRQATYDDDAKCQPNPMQLNAWAKQEAAKYRPFYFVLVFFIACLVLKTLLDLWGLDDREQEDGTVGKKYGNINEKGKDKRKGSKQNKKGKWSGKAAKNEKKTPNGPTKMTLRFRIIVAGFVLGTRVVDFMTDWAFYDLSVRSAERFEEIMERKHGSRDSYVAFKTAVLMFCILGTLMIVPDMFAMCTKQQATKLNRPPPKSTKYVTLFVLIFEEIPMLALNLMYLKTNADANKEIQNKEYRQDTDLVAVFSLVMTCGGILTNALMLARPGWFFKMKDKTTGNKLEAVEGEMGRAMGSFYRKMSITRGTSKKSETKKKTKKKSAKNNGPKYENDEIAVFSNPTYMPGNDVDQGGGNVDEYIDVEGGE
jgi:hypothetical protein